MALTPEELAAADAYFSRRYKRHTHSKTPPHPKERALHAQFKAVALQSEPSPQRPPQITKPSSVTERKQRRNWAQMASAAREYLAPEDRPLHGEKLIDCYMRKGRAHGGEEYIVRIHLNAVLRDQLAQDDDLNAEFQTLIGPAQKIINQRKQDRALANEYL